MGSYPNHYGLDMDISRLKIGILHSVIGKNDGVSIVIDQSLKTMVKIMNIPLGNIYYLAGQSPPRLNTTLDDIFWHRNDINKHILANYAGDPEAGLDELINKNVKVAKSIIAEFVESHELDVFIVHNSCHPANFIYSVAIGKYFEERRKSGIKLPYYLLWWHDSHFERLRFSKPNAIIKKHLKYIPGSDVDGVIFINTEQPEHAKKYLKAIGVKDFKTWFNRKATIIPNTIDIPWDWREKAEAQLPLVPPQDPYNKNFLKDIGIIDALAAKGYASDEMVLLLQHTRVVERKRIDVAIDFAFRLQKKFRKKALKKCIVILISGHSGDETGSHREFLENYFTRQLKKHEDMADSIILVFGEHLILPNREVIANRKFYQYSDIPDIVAAHGGMGTFFSETENFGNNLLEMLAKGLPVILNEYDIYKSDVKPLNLKVASVENCKLNEKAVTQSFEFIVNGKIREKTIRHNLEILESMLSQNVLAEKLTPLIKNMFRYS